MLPESCFFFFFNDTATTEIYTLSLHDALPIWDLGGEPAVRRGDQGRARPVPPAGHRRSVRRPALHLLRDRKSTRLNSSHQIISYAVFCLKKKKQCCHPQLRCWPIHYHSPSNRH